MLPLTPLWTRPSGARLGAPSANGFEAAVLAAVEAAVRAAVLAGGLDEDRFPTRTPDRGLAPGSGPRDRGIATSPSALTEPLPDPLSRASSTAL